MAEMILRKTGIVLLNILKGLLAAALIILKLISGAAKVFLLLFILTVRVVLALLGASAHI